MYDIFSLTDDVTGIFIDLKNLQLNNNGELLFLDEYLEKYNDSNFLIINVIPIDNISNNIVDINKENSDYVENIFNIVSKYSSLTIYFCSTSTRILDTLKNVFIHKNCGYYISEDLNYPDSDFYIIQKNSEPLFIITQNNIYSTIKKTP